MKKQTGFTLLELLITVTIVGILASIALPAYTGAVTKSKRRAAEACLSDLATHMERFYTTNLRYNNADNSSPTLPSLDCRSAQNSGKDYAFSVTATRSTYALSATPITGQMQASRDTQCGTLTLNQSGTRGASGASGAAGCW